MILFHVDSREEVAADEKEQEFAVDGKMLEVLAADASATVKMGDLHVI